MKKKGRRLKRFLGLQREAGIAWSGGIEHLLPGQISGWVVAKGVDPVLGRRVFSANF